MRTLWIVENDDVGGEELLHAGEESGLSEVFEDAGSINEVHKTTLSKSKENEIAGPRKRKKKIR